LPWNDEAKISAFRRGLSREIKQRLSFIDPLPLRLVPFVERCLKIDARIIELNNELRNTGPVSFGTQAFHSRTPSFQPPAQEPPVLYSEPMQIDAAVVSRLTPEEKNRRFQERLCFRCGKPGHVAKSCPL
ncbi:uncharacterized protein BJ171DRAFT_406465, partial [Polychytrium aggregatum]|uniref:uncharacterized protein n=1 Tax=Polychytrium aggregatum TaxID=110093 RepID=UPI0022FE0978